MNAGIIICTRPKSSRLPGKVFMEVGGMSAIEHILARLQACNLPVVLAVPTGCTDYDYLIDFFSVARLGGINFDLRIYYGDPESPLHRMAAVADMNPQWEWIVRITHDDILIDKTTMLDLLQKCAEDEDCGYGITPSIVDGAGVEVIRRDNLILAAAQRLEPTEFVSYFVKSYPFKGIKIVEPRETVRRPYRLTMDYYADWLVLDTVLDQVGASATLDDVCHFIDTHPQITSWNRQPTVSFYTCVKNGQEFIRSAMQSVLTTMGVDFEYIIIDDGSTDKTAVIVSEIGHDQRVRFFKNKKSLGLASASNIAINKARGRYVMRVDADDIILPHAAQSMVRLIDSSHTAAVYSGYHEIDPDGNVLSLNVHPQKVHHAGCAMFDHKMLNEIRFTDGLRHFDGADLHKRIQARRLPISYIARPLWLYRRHGANLSNSDQEERRRVREQLSLGVATATTQMPA